MKTKKILSRLLIAIAGILVIALLIIGYLYASSPAVIRKPAFQHYHFRMQLLIDGKPENFAETRYQQGYSKDNCNVDLTKEPIHFHDKKNQIVHIHWDGITGGLVLKYYGWNYIGGPDTKLGYRFDKLPVISGVPIHGKNLPSASKDSGFYVYTGDKESYKEHGWSDFLNKDLEEFFGKQSSVQAKVMPSILDKLLPKAYAHAGHSHEDGAGIESETEEQKLTRINNLLGNVVVFAQKDKPSTDEVKAAFNRLEPLTDSTCGG